MADVEFIRRLRFREGWTERRIAREFHISRKTVHKYLDRSTPLIQPAYTRSKPRPAPKMDGYRETIDAWLLSDVDAPKDQRHTAHRIYTRLVEQGATDLAESSVRRYVRQRRQVVAPKPPAVFLHLEFLPGQLGQVDWGEATIILDGVPTKVQLFAMRLGYSTRPFVRLYPNARMECFLDAHNRAFAFFGGCLPLELVYDNLSSAVQKVLNRRGRVLNPTFQSFVAHCLFQPVFANVASGWEKGLVEQLVGYARRNYLVPVPQVRSLEQANDDLLRRLDADLDRIVPERAGRTVRQLFDEEREGMRFAPPSVFPACTRHTVQVSHQSTVRHLQVQYSVPARLVGCKELQLRAFPDHIEVYDRERRVARHPMGQRGQPPILDLDHYLDVLVHKPGGVRHARVVNQLGEEVRAYRDAFLHLHPDAYGTFVQILLLSRHYTLEAVVAGIAKAHTERIYDVARVESLIANGTAGAAARAVRTGPTVRQPALDQYDGLVAATGAIA